MPVISELLGLYNNIVLNEDKASDLLRIREQELKLDRDLNKLNTQKSKLRSEYKDSVDPINEKINDLYDQKRILNKKYSQIRKRRY